VNPPDNDGVPALQSASATLPASPKWGPLGIVAFWLVMMGALYVLMNQYLKPKPVTVTASGALVIAKSRDGHFYADGSVGGSPVRFLVDTGASMVVVSAELAQRAGLKGGVPTVFKTANGGLAGRILRDVPVTVGPVKVSGIRVGVGLVGGKADEALLGQSFLNQFDLTVSGSKMTLQPKSP